MVGTRGQLLLMVRKQPGSTVTELAEQLGISGVAVRRQLSALSRLGLVEPVPPRADDDHHRRGRPAGGWRVTPAGLAHAPGNYDTFALDLLAQLDERDGSEAVDGLLQLQARSLANHYRCCLADFDELRDRVKLLAELRDDAGYDAFTDEDDGALRLTECNCAVYRVAEKYPVLCALELELMRDVLGPDVDVQRVSHTMQGDGVCAYRIVPLATRAAAATPAAPA